MDPYSCLDDKSYSDILTALCTGKAIRYRLTALQRKRHLKYLKKNTREYVIDSQSSFAAPKSRVKEELQKRIGFHLD